MGRHLPRRSSPPGPARRVRAVRTPAAAAVRPLSKRVSRGGGYSGLGTQLAALRRAVGWPSSPAPGRKPRVSSAAVGSRGSRPARPLGSGAQPPPPRSLPSPRSLCLERAPTPTPQRAASSPGRALGSPRARAGVAPLAPRKRVESRKLAAQRGLRAPCSRCDEDYRAGSGLMVPRGLPSKPQILVSPRLWRSCPLRTTFLVVLADVASILDLGKCVKSESWAAPIWTFSLSNEPQNRVGGKNTRWLFALDPEFISSLTLGG